MQSAILMEFGTRVLTELLPKTSRENLKLGCADFSCFDWSGGAWQLRFILRLAWEDCVAKGHEKTS